MQHYLDEILRLSACRYTNELLTRACQRGYLQEDGERNSSAAIIQAQRVALFSFSFVIRLAVCKSGYLLN